MPTVEPDIALAERLFETLRRETAGEIGIHRPSFGPGEQAAHDLIRRTGEELGMEVAIDAAGNQYLTLPGGDRGRLPILLGSHLDAVPQGGNYDGAAGVIVGIAACAGFRRAGVIPPRDVTIMCIRAEESNWFPASYIGSRAAFGLLPAEVLDGVRRSDSGRTLAEHMAENGFDPEALRAGKAHLRREAVGAFLEVHIEQGPVLEERAVPVGVVTGIRGSFRYREARCLGVYAHSGATPRQYRRDAVAATAALITDLDRGWQRLEAAGHDLAITVGMIATDARAHAFSKVAGEVAFCVDVRSQSEETLALVRRRVDKLAARIAGKRGVRFALGPLTGSKPARMDAGIRARLGDIAGRLAIPTVDLASGAGHDASVFANQGVPTGMLFIRNQHGSHNPDEAMEIADFAKAAAIVTAFLGEQGT